MQWDEYVFGLWCDPKLNYKSLLRENRNFSFTFETSLTFTALNPDDAVRFDAKRRENLINYESARLKRCRTV